MLGQKHGPNSKPTRQRNVEALSGASEEDQVPATEAILHYPTAIAERLDGKVLVVIRNANNKSIVREIYPLDGRNLIHTIAGGGASRAYKLIPAQSADFGEIQSLITIDDLTFLVVTNNNLSVPGSYNACVWKVRWETIETSIGKYFTWKALKIVVMA